MQVKVCPGCKAENRPGSASCSNCYQPLEDVAVTTSDKAAPVTPTVTARTASDERRPETGPASASQGHYGPPPGASSYQPPMRERPAPAKRGVGAGVVVLALILLAAAGYGGWFLYRNLLSAPNPEQTVSLFIDACRSGDYENIKLYLPKETIEQIEALPNGESMVAEAMRSAISAGAKEAGEDYTIGAAAMEGDERAVVPVDTKDPGELPGGIRLPARQEVVLCKEEGRWKVDLNETGRRYGEAIRRSMPSSAPAPGPTPPPRSGG